MTLEEHIRALWEQTYAGCDPPVEGDPRKYSLGWFREGYNCGLKDGEQIGQQVFTADSRRLWDMTWNLGHAQGIAYGVFLASNCELRGSYDSATLYGAAVMREIIMEALEAAAKSDRTRIEAKA